MDFRKSVFVAGALHVVHNCTKNLPTVLLHSREWQSQLKQICKMLSGRNTKARFMQTCMVAPALRLAKSRAVSAVFLLQFTKADGLDHSRMRQGPLVQRILNAAWSSQEYSYGAPNANAVDHADEHRVSVATVGAAIKSDFFELIP